MRVHFIEMGIVVICSLILSNFQMDVNIVTVFGIILKCLFVINRRKRLLASIKFGIFFENFLCKKTTCQVSGVLRSTDLQTFHSDWTTQQSK